MAGTLEIEPSSSSVSSSGTALSAATARHRGAARLWIAVMVLASIGLVSLVKVNSRSLSKPVAVQLPTPKLELGFMIDGGPVVRGGELPTLVGLGALIEPVASVDWAGGAESRLLVYLGDRQVNPGEAVRAERPGRLLLRAEIEGETPQVAEIEIRVSKGPEHRLDLEIRAEAVSADGSECFTARVQSKTVDVRELKLRSVRLLIRSVDDICILELDRPAQDGEQGLGSAVGDYVDGALVLRFCRRVRDLPLPRLPRSYSVRASGTVGNSRTLGGFESPYVEGIELDRANSVEAAEKVRR